MKTIYFDTETTGLVKNEALPPSKQPRIIELAMVSVDERGEKEFTTLLDPGVSLEPAITQITGLTDADLKDAPKFEQIVPGLVEFVKGADILVAHNVRFDHLMLLFELRRLDLEHRFPWPFKWVDTVEVSGGKKLADWAKELLGAQFTNQSHRALDDVRLMMRCLDAHQK